MKHKSSFSKYWTIFSMPFSLSGALVSHVWGQTDSVHDIQTSTTQVFSNNVNVLKVIEFKWILSDTRRETVRVESDDPLSHSIEIRRPIYLFLRVSFKFQTWSSNYVEAPAT